MMLKFPISVNIKIQGIRRKINRSPAMLLRAYRLFLRTLEGVNRPKACPENVNVARKKSIAHNTHYFRYLDLVSILFFFSSKRAQASCPFCMQKPPFVFLDIYNNNNPPFTALRFCCNAFFLVFCLSFSACF